MLTPDGSHVFRSRCLVARPGTKTLEAGRLKSSCVWRERLGKGVARVEEEELGGGGGGGRSKGAARFQASSGLRWRRRKRKAGKRSATVTTVTVEWRWSRTTEPRLSV